MKYTKSCQELDKINLVLDWSKVTQNNFSNLQGEVKLVTEESSILCAENKLQRKRMLFVISQAFTFNDASKICMVFGGKIFLPRNQKQLNEMVGILPNNSNDKCQGRYWIPIKKNLDFEWFDAYGTTTAPFLPWNPREPNGRHLQQCAVYKDGFYHDVTCIAPSCFVCSIESIVKFKLRGLDFDTLIDDHYIVHKHKFNDLPIFKGISRGQILYDNVDNRWVIYDSSSLLTNHKLESSKIWGYHKVEDGLFNLPIGVNNWTIIRPSGKVHQKLKLTNVILKLILQCNFTINFFLVISSATGTNTHVRMVLVLTSIRIVMVTEIALMMDLMKRIVFTLDSKSY